MTKDEATCYEPLICVECNEYYSIVIMPDGRTLCQRCYRWHSETAYRALLDQEDARQREYARTGRDPREETP